MRPDDVGKCCSCRFDSYRFGNMYEPPSGECGREGDVDELAEARGLDDVEWGSEEPCPLWESPKLVICSKCHEVYDEAEFCVKCMHPAEEETT